MPAWSITQTSAPSSEPVTRAEAKKHLYVDGSADDDYIDDLIAAARTSLEESMSRQLMQATWALYLDDFWGAKWIQIPRPPLSSVTSIAYDDTDGNSQTFASSKYVVDTDSQPGRIRLAVGESWPTVYQDTDQAVTITFVAGYASAAAVPMPIKQAILTHVATMYAYREDVSAQVVNMVHDVGQRLTTNYTVLFETPWR